MFKLAYLAGQAAALRDLNTKIAEGPAPQPGDLPPIRDPRWSTRVNTGHSAPRAGGGIPGPTPRVPAAAAAAGGGGEGLLKRLAGGLGKKPLVGAGMALGAGAGLAMMNPSEPQMRVVPSAPLQQYFP